MSVPFVGWEAASPLSESDFAIRISSDGCHGSGPCAHFAPAAKARGWGGLRRSLDATPFRGRRLRVLAFVRAEGAVSPLDGALVSLRVVNDHDDPIAVERSPRKADAAWSEATAFVDVPVAATRIDVGVHASAGGRLYVFDDVRLEDLGRAGAGDSPQRPLSDRGLANLVAFARLYGYVRYFHPSDEVAGADWDAVARAGVRACEAAADAAELTRCLAGIFMPFGPTLQIWTGSRAPPAVLTAPGDKTLFWLHSGVAGNSRYYGSHRVAAGSPEARPVADPPDPARPFEAELGDGIFVRVPLALAADAGGTLPHGRVPPAALQDGALPSGNDRTTRLADVIVAWNVFEHFFPYFPDARVDWPAALRTALASAATDAGATAFARTLSRLVASIHDGHARVTSAGAPPVGRLPLAWDWVEDEIVVTAVAPDGPPHLRRGDVVARIGGRETADLVAEHEELVSAATPWWGHVGALAELAMGPPGQRVDLDVEHTGGSRETVAVAYGPAGAVPFREPRRAPLSTPAPGIRYVDLTTLDGAEIEAAVPDLRKAKGIIVDMRGYPREIFGVVNHLATKPISSLVGHLPLSTRPDGVGRILLPRPFTMFPAAPHIDARVVFLTNAQAISSAENLLSLVEAGHLGPILGSATAGTTGEINWFQLPGGYEIYWSGMKITRSDGSRFHGVGIQPTIPVARTRAGIAAGRDEVLEAAVAWLER